MKRGILFLIVVFALTIFSCRHWMLSINAQGLPLTSLITQLSNETQQTPTNPDKGNENLTKLDPQQSSISQFRQKRLPEGLEDLPVENYLTARQRMLEMQHYSTAQNRHLTSSELVGGDSSSNWTELGPGNIGGRTRALVIHPTNPNTMFAAASAGGVWKTTDGGASWHPLTDTLSNLAVNALAMDPQNPNVIYAGTGEGFYSSGSIQGLGIFKTTDGGANWFRLASTANQDFSFVNDIVISSANRQRIYVATRTGVWRSTDGGTSWESSLNPQIASGCVDLEIRTDQVNDVVFASCGTLQQSAVYRNADAGSSATWNVVLSETGMYRTSLAIAPSNQNIIYASSANSSQTDQPGLFAVFRSTSGGEANSWTAQVRGNSTNKLNTVLFSWTLDAFYEDCKLGLGRFFNTGWYSNSIAVDPTDSNRVWVGGVDLFRSDDGGANWGLASYSWLDSTAPQYAHAHHHKIVFPPQFDGRTNKTMIVAGDGGIYKTDDASAAVATVSNAACDANLSAVRWHSLNNGYSATKLFHGAAFPNATSYLVGAEGHGFLIGSDAAGINGWKKVVAVDGGYVAIDPLRPNELYTLSSGLLRKSSDGGQTFAFASLGLSLSGSIPVPPLVADPSDGRRLWTGGRSLMKTTDGASHWSSAGQGFQQQYSFTAIAVSPIDSNYVLGGTGISGTGNGAIVRHSNALGQQPALYLPYTTPRSGYVSWIAFDPVEPNVVYATYSTFGGKHVWRSTDKGENWVEIDGSGAGTLPDIPVHCIVVDPENRQRLFVGTDIGVFVSLDGGQSWAVESGLPNVVTEALAIKTSNNSSQIFAFTFGRGAWKTQLGAVNCQSAISPASVSFPGEGGSQNIAVSINSDCPWSASVNPSGEGWISINGNSSGSGNGSIKISIAANGTGQERTGTISVAGRSLTITQATVIDTIAPKLKITSPTSEVNWTTSSPAIVLSGTATDNVSIAKINWRIDRSGQYSFPAAAVGDVIGTTNWTTSSISLPTGYSTITITATDTSNLTTSAQLRILRLPGSTLIKIVGNGETFFNGDHRPGLLTAISSATGLAKDVGGNIYFVDHSNGRIRKLNPDTGIVSVVAGGGQSDEDNIPATQALLPLLSSIALDPVGNIYFLDNQASHRIRKISTNGLLTTVAGAAGPGYAGDGGPAAQARFNNPRDLEIDPQGNIYIADSGNTRVRKIDATTGIISTIAGKGVRGTAGDGGPATQAELGSIGSLALDNAGNLYFSDQTNNAIRKVAISSGLISTFAGMLGSSGFAGDEGPATQALMNTPTSIAFDSANNLYITDANNARIRKVIASSGIITTIFGNRSSQPATGSSLLVDRSDTLVIGAQAFIYRLLPFWIPNDSTPPTVTITNPSTPTVQLPSSGGNIVLEGTVTDNVQVSHLSWSNDRGGSGLINPPSCCDRWITSTSVLQPGLNNITVTAWDSVGNSASARVAVTTPAGPSGDGTTIRTFAGNALAGFSGDGWAGSLAQLWSPEAIALDSSGSLLIADTFNHRIRKITRDGLIVTIAGTGVVGSEGDGGQATEASLNFPRGVAVDANGNVYIADNSNNRIRKIATNGIISTIAGTGSEGFSGDGGLAINATLNSPYGIAVDSSSNVYFSDYGNHRIRRIAAASGIITTVAGNGYGSSGDGGLATAALLKYPTGVLVDGQGNLFIGDTGNSRVRKVTQSGIISTVAGNGVYGIAQDGVPAVSTSLRYPTAMVLDSGGNLLIADRASGRLYKVSPNGTLTFFAGTGVFSSQTEEGLPALSFSLNLPSGLAIDRGGSVYIAEAGGNRILVASNYQTAACVSAASFTGQSLAADSIAAVFGSNLATTIESAAGSTLPTSLAGTTVRIRDSAGIERLASLFFVSPSQINFHIPPEVASGTATLIIRSGAGKASTSNVNIAPTAAGLFTANTSGQGVAIGEVLRIKPDGRQIYDPIAVYDQTLKRFIPRPIKIEDPGERLFLILYATGLRGHGDQSKVKVRISGEELPVLYASAQGTYVGLDQINVEVTPPLLNRGEVDLTVFVDGVQSNTARVTFGEKLCEYVVTFQAPTPDFSAFSGAGGTANFNVVTNFDCGWYARSETGWITPQFGNPLFGGSANPRFRVEANPNPVPRSGTVRIAGQVFTINQAAAGSPDSPTLRVLNPESSSLTTNLSSISISGVASGSPDIAFIEWSNDRGGSGTTSGLREWTAHTIPLQVGVNNITITAYDLLSRARSSSVTVNFKPDWQINAFAGEGQNPPGNGVPSTSVKFTFVSAMAFDPAGNLFIADMTRILKVTPSGILSIALGDGGDFFVNIARAGGMAFDAAGNLHFTDLEMNCVRRADFQAKLTVTVAGKCRGTGFFNGDGGLATNASLYQPTDIKFDAAGNLFIADTSNGRIRKVDTATGIITTIAGNGSSTAPLGDGGPATSARLDGPRFLAFKNGELFVTSDISQRVRKINLSTGVITTFAGGGTNNPGDGLAATDVSLSPYGLAFDPTGNLYLTDMNRLRRIAASTETITTIAGTGAIGDSGDGGAALLAQIGAINIALDTSGNIYITNGLRIRKLTPFPTTSIVEPENRLPSRQ